LYQTGRCTGHVAHYLGALFLLVAQPRCNQSIRVLARCTHRDRLKKTTEERRRLCSKTACSKN
jgi:hypothetical protein